MFVALPTGIKINVLHKGSVKTPFFLSVTHQLAPWSKPYSEFAVTANQRLS